MSIPDTVGSWGTMELWEIEARECIRDLVARYNSNGDAGRFGPLMELFAPDAVMVVEGEAKTGHAEIMTIFTGAKDLLAGEGASAPRPRYLRHLTATHQIDLIDQEHATGRCYFQVLTSIGLDHWGRYVDEYRKVDGSWKFSKRTVTVDDHSPGSRFARSR